jgi:hypothetical protein
LVKIDAKNWSSKAKKWIPVQNGVDNENMSGQKRAKLVDIRDHLTKANPLREKLVLSPAECEVWYLKVKRNSRQSLRPQMIGSNSMKSIWSMTIDGILNEAASCLQQCNRLWMRET